MIGASSIRSSCLAIGTLLFSAIVQASPNGCAEWSRRVAALPATAHAALERYGAYADGDWVLFGKQVVATCEQRASFSRYAGSVVRGIAPAASDVTMVAANKKEFVRALAEIWPTRGREFPGEDGAFREQLSALLTTRELDARSTRPLLEKIISQDGVTGEVAYVLLTRPDAALRTMIEAHTVQKRGVTKANVYAVAILQALGDDVATNLQTLLKSRLTATQRAVVEVLQARLRKHTKPSWDDVRDLETDFVAAGHGLARPATEVVPLAPVTLGPYVYDAAENVTQIGEDRYQYDAMNRLQSGTATAPGHPENNQQFTYDGFGNLQKVITSNAPDLYIDVDQSSNHLRDVAGTPAGTGTYTWGGGYDEAGNQLQLNGGAYRYEYDALNAMVALRNSAGRRQFYLYAADGERLATIDYADAANTTWHYTVRDLKGRVVRTSTNAVVGGASAWQWQSDNIYRDGSMLASVQSTGLTSSVSHDHLDHLGSPVLITNAAHEQTARYRFWPFGGEAPGSTVDAQPMKFTGHERDSDGSIAALDYMHARFYSSLTARFLAVDPVLNARRAQGNPQGWNRYAYVLNQPLKLTDPTGMYDLNCTTGTDRDQKRCSAAALRFEDQRQKDLKSKKLSVRNAAAAWGNLNDHNGVTVAFKSQRQVNSDAGRTDGNTDGFVDPTGSKNGVVNIQAEFVYSLGDGKLAQTVAHEGSHIEEDMRFIHSFDSSTKTYNGALNMTHFDTEFRAYSVGSEVSRYPDFNFGPKGYPALTTFIEKNYPNADDLVFSPSQFPQK